MEDFESLHFVGDWGALVSEDGELASVPDLVRVLAHGGMPAWAAVDEVLDRIGHDATVRGYITHPHKFARPIDPQYDWAARFPESRVRPSWAPRSFDDMRGLHWLIEVLRAYWKQARSPADWQDAQRSPGERFEQLLYVALFGGQFAIHLDDAHRLFKDELIAAVPASMQAGTVAAEPAPPEGAAAEVVKPESRIDKALKRLRELDGRKGAVKTVAAEFSVNERTVRDWRAQANEKAVEAQRVSLVISSMTSGLSSNGAAIKARA